MDCLDRMIHCQLYQPYQLLRLSVLLSFPRLLVHFLNEFIIGFQRFVESSFPNVDGDLFVDSRIAFENCPYDDLIIFHRTVDEKIIAFKKSCGRSKSDLARIKWCPGAVREFTIDIDVIEKTFFKTISVKIEFDGLNFSLRRCLLRNKPDKQYG
jgi:hypothetical protein